MLTGNGVCHDRADDRTRMHLHLRVWSGFKLNLLTWKHRTLEPSSSANAEDLGDGGVILVAASDTAVGLFESGGSVIHGLGGGGRELA